MQLQEGPNTPDPQETFRQLRIAIDEIKARSGASDEDAIRLIQAYAKDPVAADRFFHPEQHGPNAVGGLETFMGAPISNMPGAPGYEAGQPSIPVPPAPAMMAPPPEPPSPGKVQPLAPLPASDQPYKPLFYNEPTTISPEQRIFSQGIVDQGAGTDRFGSIDTTYQENVMRHVEKSLGPEGVAILHSNIVIPSEIRGYYVGGNTGNIVANNGSILHEVAHAFQSAHHNDLTPFVDTVLRLAREGNPVAAEGAYRGYGPMSPGEVQGAYQGVTDPQHLYTWFIDNEVRHPGSTPDALKPFYKGLVVDDFWGKGIPPYAPPVPQNQIPPEPLITAPHNWRAQTMATMQRLISENGGSVQQLIENTHDREGIDELVGMIQASSIDSYNIHAKDPVLLQQIHDRVRPDHTVEDLSALGLRITIDQ